MRSKWMMVLLSAAMLSAMSVPAFAGDLRETVSGKESLQLLIAEKPEADGTHRYPIEVNGESVDALACVMVPLRAVAEPLGFTVTWDNGGVLVDNGTIHTRVTIGVDQYVITTSKEDLVGMSAPFSLGAAPYVVDGVTYVPLGLFNALLGNREGAVALEENTIVIRSGDTELANPFVSCATLEEAEQIAGFALELPVQIPSWAKETTIRAVDSALIEVTYQGQGHELTVRKGAGSEDISGDYTVYEHQETVTVDGCPVTIKGTEEQAAVAVWTRGGYTYAVSAAPGMEFADMTALAAAVR